MQKSSKTELITYLGYFLGLLFGITMVISETFAQTYEFSLVPRYRYDQIHLEIWGKSLTANAPKIGGATIVISYNSQFLSPAAEQNRAVTDSINANINQLDPIDRITSPYNLAANGFDVLESQSYTLGYYALELKQRTLGAGGYTPAASGKGTFFGKVIFNITGNPSDNSLTDFDFSRSTLPGDIRIFDYQGNDIEADCNFVNPGRIPVIGINILSPGGTKQVLDRDMDYISLSGDYAGSGYPIYFERSVSPSQFNVPVDDDLAYIFEYSLNNGNNWNVIGRVAETGNPSSAAGNNTRLRSGEIFNANKSTAYTITNQFGQKLEAATYRDPVRVIWSKNPNFTERSEEARIRITRLAGFSTIDINSRTKDGVFAVAKAKIILGRLFFVQLAGNNSYLRTPDNISNSTQLTVETWINLNEYKPKGSETGIVVSSAGPNATPILGSREGAWMLFLKDGRIPAFRAREIQARGESGYIGTVSANYIDSLPIVDSGEPLADAHAKNWMHIAATVSNNTLSLYINGELVDRYTNNQATDIRMLTTSHPIWIGVNPNNDIDQTDYLTAGLKAVRVWRVALSQDEIRQRTAGVFAPSVTTAYGDLRRGLQLYYSLEGTLSDLANDITYQFGPENADYYYANAIANEQVKYRPDRPHIRLTAPTAGSGVSNRDGSQFEIRWVSYGIGDISKTGTKDLDIEYSIDGGANWFYSRDAAGKTLGGALAAAASVDVETGTVGWFARNDNPSPNIKTINPYTREAILKIKGTDANNQADLYDSSGYFSMAPYFSVYKSEASIIAVPNNSGMNITGSTAFLELWVRPYRFPTVEEGYFPLISKIDSSSGYFHYDLRLLPDGKLQFRLMDINNQIRTSTSSLELVRPNSIALDSVWSHVGVYLFLNNGAGSSEIRFYIDGVPDRDTLSTQALGTDIKVNTSNTYPAYIGYYPSNSTKGTGDITVAGSQTQNISLLGNINSALAANLAPTTTIYDKNGTAHTLGITITRDAALPRTFNYTSQIDNLNIRWLTPKISLSGNLDAAALANAVVTAVLPFYSANGTLYNLQAAFTKSVSAAEYNLVISYNNSNVYQSQVFFNSNGTLKSPLSISLSAQAINQAVAAGLMDAAKPELLIIELANYDNLMAGVTNFPRTSALTAKDEKRQIIFNQDGSLYSPAKIELESYYLNTALANQLFDAATPKNLFIKLKDDFSGTSLTGNTNPSTAAFSGQDGIATRTIQGEVITTADTSRGFVGELKEVRFWNGTPNNASPQAAQEPTPMTLFVQGAQAVRASTLTNSNNANLHSYYSYNGGGFVVNGWARAAGSYPNTNIVPRYFGNPIKYIPTEPYIRLVEPTFKQKIANTSQDVRVRWVGFDYDGDGFNSGTTVKAPSLEFSIRGGGGQLIQPYQYVGCDYWKGNIKDAVSFPSNSKFKFSGTGQDIIYALNLDATIADPDDFNDGTMKQGPLSASLTNARFRLTGQYSLFTQTNILSTEGPIFSITPASNFTVRVLLEGHHDGSTAGKTMFNVGTTYAQGGFRIKLYRDIGTIGDLVAEQESTLGYDVLDPLHRNNSSNRFANVNYIFTELTDGDYWVKVEHINHLPILSRYPAVFKYTGDDRATWRIESGWDFTSWNGIDDNVLLNQAADPYQGGVFTAYGYAKKTYSDPYYSQTGLIYNDGRSGSALKPLAAMVGGDVNQDLQINAADRVQVRQDDGTGLVRSDVTGDGFVNADDRTITDRNFGKVASIYNVTFPQSVTPISPLDPFNYISEKDTELSKFFVDNAKIELKNKNVKSKSEELQAGIAYDVTAEPILKGDYVELNFFIKNKGGDFALANATFAVKYNSSVLEFAELSGQDSVIFHNKPEVGYANLRTAPTADAVNPLPEVRTVEVDYDAFARLQGVSVPRTNTYLGTLRFKLKIKRSAITFTWHASTSVHSTDNRLVTPEGNFVMIPPILLYSANLVSPNGGEKYAQGKKAEINWTTNGDANVLIIFSGDNGMNWDTLTPSPININALKYEWTTPNYSSSRCKVKIIDAETGYYIDQSDDFFSLVPSFAQIIRPSSGDPVYIGGKQDNIRWTAQGYEKVRFEFSPDGGGEWTSVSMNVNSTEIIMPWNLPKVTTKTAIVRMIDIDNDKEICRSGMFKILSGSVTFKAPVEGEKLVGGKDTRIRWTSSDVNFFDIQLSTDCGLHWELIKSNVAAYMGYLNWNIVEVNSDCAYIRAIWNGDPEMEYARTGMFSIISKLSAEDDLPAGVEFKQIMPNPAKSHFTIEYNIINDEDINFAVYSYSGEMLKDLGTEFSAAGNHRKSFENLNLYSGKYIIVITSKRFKLLRELIIAE